ncbi:MAG: ABC transporter substrate-binding protein [Paracoccaceae bacterium]
MAKLNLSLACWDYDRVRALMDGTVQPDGINLIFQPLVVEETFFRMLRYREFDVAELSMSSFIVSLTKPDRPFVGIPVFPSRFFRHSCIYVNADSGIQTPQDLIGKRVGSPEYQMTAPVWIRGILAEHYGVPVDGVIHVTGGEESPGRDEKIPINLPDNFRLERINGSQTLAAMLRDGEIDALVTARKPSTYDGQRVIRLFPDYVNVERDYWSKTGIFPIMHVIAIRREVYEENRWIARALYKAFADAQARTYASLKETAALKGMLPWFNANVEDAIELMGDEFWPYGLHRNRTVLDTFLRYHAEQGLSDGSVSPEDMFAPETFDEFVI